MPENPIAAVSHANPYPYYDALRRERPFSYHAELGMWVAASAHAVQQVLSSRGCRVRPANEPAPAALSGNAAGALFTQLIRMRDDPERSELRDQLNHWIEKLTLAEVVQTAAEQTRELLAARVDLDNMLDQIPVRSVAALLGVPREHIGDICALIQTFVRALAPDASAAHVQAGTRAAETLAKSLQHTPLHVANAVCLLMQSYEATAGLIANTLVAVALTPAGAEPHDYAALVQRVLRDDPPVQNTRRFIAENTPLLGERLQAGDRVLVVVAAAQRDPAAQLFTFGHGPHACPGAQVAHAIAHSAVRQLCLHMTPPETWIYRNSINIRIARFDSAQLSAS